MKAGNGVVYSSALQVISSFLTGVGDVDTDAGSTRE
jgi:hypothetical protein